MNNLKTLKSKFLQACPTPSKIKEWESSIDTLISTSEIVLTTSNKITSSVTHFPPIIIPEGSIFRGFQGYITSDILIPSSSGNNISGSNMTLRVSFDEPISEKENASDPIERQYILIQNGEYIESTMGSSEVEFTTFYQGNNQTDNQYNGSKGGRTFGLSTSQYGVTPKENNNWVILRGTGFPASNPTLALNNVWEASYYETLSGNGNDELQEDFYNVSPTFYTGNMIWPNIIDAVLNNPWIGSDGTYRSYSYYSESAMSELYKISNGLTNNTGKDFGMFTFATETKMYISVYINESTKDNPLGGSNVSWNTAPFDQTFEELGIGNPVEPANSTGEITFGIAINPMNIIN